MVRVPIRFVDHLGRETGDYIGGFPVVDIQIDVGIDVPANPALSVQPNFRRVRALIDTGADHTTIKPDLAHGLQSIRTVSAHSMLGAGYSSVHHALILVDGFSCPLLREVATAPLKSIDVALGRDVLSEYRLVYDTPRREFYLES